MFMPSRMRGRVPNGTVATLRQVLVPLVAQAVADRTRSSSDLYRVELPACGARTRVAARIQSRRLRREDARPDVLDITRERPHVCFNC